MISKLAKPLCAILIVVALPIPAKGQAKVYWSHKSDSSAIRRGNLDGTAKETLLNFNADGISLDVSQGIMYLRLPGTNDKISRTNLDGTNLVDFVIAEDIGGMALDLPNGKIYWSVNDFSGNAFSIMRANFDGSTVETFYSLSVEVGALAIDQTRGYLYWVESNIFVKRLLITDTSNVQIRTGSNNKIYGIAIDTQTQDIYFAERNGLGFEGRIRRWLNNGINTTETIALGGIAPRQIAIDQFAGIIYWSVSDLFSNGSINRANLDGSNIETYVSLAGNGEVLPAGGIALDLSNRDGDGIPDINDNCPFDSNASQADVDDDNIGDACDNCPNTPNFDQSDMDGDSIGDVCDNCNMPNSNQDDCQDNGVGDVCEIAAGSSLDCNSNQIPDECESQSDCNNNSIQDICDITIGTSSDCNLNSIPDECEQNAHCGSLTLTPLPPNSSNVTSAGLQFGDFYIVPPGGAVLELNMLVTNWFGIGDGNLQAVHAKIDGAGYSNGIGGDIQPMNFATPDGCPNSGNTCSDGAFIVKRIGIISGCNCDNGPCDPIDNGLCKNNPDYVFKNITTIADVTFPGLDYAFENTSIGISVAEPDASGNYIGTIILNIPPDADGLYQISLTNNTAETYLVDGTGAIFPIDDLPPTNILVTSAPLDDTRDRYISFDPSIDGATATAFRVTVLGLAGQIADKYVAAPNANGVSQLVDTPVFRDWTESLVYVGDCIIAPGNFYDISPTADDINFGTATFVATTPTPAPRFYGDAVGAFDSNTNTWSSADGLVTANDILASVKQFQLDPTAPHFTRIDLVPATPNGVINASDVLAFALAFQGVPYPHPAPQDCP
ncbi:hypothetical protein JYU10_00035 [bacterium AH-315-J04]|nr:hypothetical protein [bacterium AH-315-J04]